MTPPPSTGDPVRDAENMRSFANQYAQIYGSDNARVMGYTGPDIPRPGIQRPGQGARPDLGVQTMDPGQMPAARGPAGFDNDGFFGDQVFQAQELNGGPLASGIFGATPTPSNPGQPMPDPQPRVGAFEPPPIPGMDGRSFSYPNVERDASVPSWMVNNPDFDPRSPSQSGMQEHTNPATGETYMGGTSSNNQYMVDPSLQGEFTTPNGGGSLMRSNGSEFSGIFGASPSPTPSPDIGLPTLAPVSSTPAPSASQPTPYTQDFDSMHREQHSQMGGGITSVAPSDNFTRPTWSGSPGPMSMGNPFSFQQPGYQTGSPFGSMPSQFGGGLPRGYYT